MNRLESLYSRFLNLARPTIRDRILFLHVPKCGGKDSLNLLSLPWENPVRVLSAKPDHLLVQEFIHRNGLPYHVRELRNEGDCRSMALLANCCRCDPDTINWLSELSQETRQHNHNVVVWMGSMADAWLTPGWRGYYVHAHRGGS